jgi:sulfur carrier protein
MHLTVNGITQEHVEPLTVQALLDVLGFEGKPVVVELNHRALFPRELAETALHDGDAVEVVQITAGG